MTDKERNLRYERAVQYFILNETESLRKVSKRFNVNAPTLKKKLLDNGINPIRKNKDKEIRANNFSKYYIEHPEMSFKEIREHFNYCEDTANRYLKMTNTVKREDIKKNNMRNNLNKAIEYYINTPKASLKQTAIKFDICRVTLKDNLVRMNIPIHKFVEHICKNGISYDSYIKFESKAYNVKYTLNDNFFENIDTEEKAYWLGFLLADGYVSPKGNEITIGLAIRDYDHLHRFKMAIKSNQHIVESKTNILKNTQKSYDSCSFTITSKKMKNDLRKHNVLSQKSMKEKPDYNLNNDLIRHYIRGFIDGDGWISVYNRSDSELSQGIRSEFGVGSSKEMVEYVNNILMDQLDINKLSINNMYSDFYTVSTSNITDIIKILKFLYDNATIYLPRKYERALEVCRLHSMSLENVND